MIEDYIITRDSSDTLQHFGTKGMKWGERRFQNPDGSLTELGRQRYGTGGERSARGTKHDLNKLDREQTNAKVNYDYYHAKFFRGIDKANNKLRKAQASGDERSILKATAKLDKALNSTSIKEAEEYKALYERSKAMTDRIIKESLAKGYSINSKDVLRSVNRGSNAIASALGTIAGMSLAAVTGVGVAHFQSEYASGKHYGVKDDGRGAETHNSR